jgi:hypothetical protein
VVVDVDREGGCCAGETTVRDAVAAEDASVVEDGRLLRALAAEGEEPTLSR